MKQDKNINKLYTYENFNIPHNWERKKIKHLFIIGRGRVISQEEVCSEEKYPVFSSQTQNNGCLGYIGTFDYNCTQLTWTTDGANAGTVFIREGKHNCTNVCGTLLPRTNSISIPFASFSLNYFCQFHKRPDTNGAKIMNNEMAEIAIILPETKKQIKIAKFLTYEQEKTNNLIQKQQQFIELLKEKRQAVISHAVTKGLNPDVPIKNSGVEWFGDVPSHWLKTIIKHIAKINPLKTKIAPDLMKKECSFIPMENLKLNKIILDEHRVIKDVYNSYTYFEDKDILMAKVTPCFENKNIAIANNLFNGIGFGTTEIYVIRCNNQVNNEFLFYRLQEDNFSAIAEGSMTGAGGLKRVPHEVVNSFQFYLPTIYEQNEIASFLNSATTKIDTLIQKQLQQIDLLKERRTALISAAVTGKIDLRDWTPPASSSEESLTAEEATA